jgi:flagellar P-ring protein precursor FlgI
MLRATLFALLALLAGASFAQDGAATASSIRVKDLGKLQGWRENALIGYGIVSGLAGTGDSPSNRTTRQTLANVLQQFNLTIPPEQVQSRNVAVVMVSAALPTFARPGDTLDITVASAGDARSLVGGSLLLTPLKAADGRVYALGQGPLAVGGYRYDSNGNVVQKNHPTVGSVPNGAVVEVGVTADVVKANQAVTFVLHDADYTTASRVAAAINRQIGDRLAHPRDASGIDITVPEGRRDQLVSFLAQVENVLVEPSRRAKVVVNERTGTVVAGGDVRISRVAISHGELKINIASETSVSQPLAIGRPSPAIRTETVTNSRIDVDEHNTGSGYLASGTTVSDLVQSLARLKTSTRDVISILRAIKAAGALHAELVVQ